MEKQGRDLKRLRRGHKLTKKREKEVKM